MKHKILLASNSKGKIREYKEMFSSIPDIELVTIKDVFGDNPPEEPEENGATFMDNAIIKAVYYADRSGLPALGDDSGLCVKALDDFPGVYSKRFCETEENPNPTDEDHNIALINRLHVRGMTESIAEYRCSLVLFFPKTGAVFGTQGICEGKFKDKCSGEHGFAYDKYFWSKDYNYNMTLADLTSEDKDNISHRGRALQQMVKELNVILQLVDSGELFWDTLCLGG